MEKKFTSYTKTIACSALTIIVLFFASVATKTYAQISCNNETVIFQEDFGTGTTPTSSPDIITTALTYQDTGVLFKEGIYRVINNTQQKGNWLASEDHTANDVDGKMLVINGQAETFYNHQIDRQQGFAPGSYTASFYVMNIDPLGDCGINALLPNMGITVEYLSASNTWEALSGSPYMAAPVNQSATPTWVAIGSSFTLPSVGGLVTSIRIRISDGEHGGCGNDFAMDDIKFSFCPEGGPMPVEFLGITARQKGTGVSVEWSTAQEINSSRFDIEKSADGNANWNLVASINAAGNSSTVKNYNAYDAKPLNGANFYRIKQVDKDGNFKYSKTVRVNLNLSKTGVSVLANPFYNSLTVDFSSATEQSVTARLVDITGKQVANEKWLISAGDTRQNFSNVAGLQRGMYILNIRSGNGEVLYNNKVMKQ
jgi:Secretion system C-terminal sorting domain